MYKRRARGRGRPHDASEPMLAFPIAGLQGVPVPEPENARPPNASSRTQHCRRPVAWAWVWIWLASAVAAVALAMTLDGQVRAWTSIPENGTGRALAAWLSKLGEGWVIAVAGVAGAGGCFLFGRVQAARLVLLVMTISLLAGLTATIGRALAGRTRPCAAVAPGFYGLRHDSQWIVGKYDYSSFPSGHGATVVGLAAAAWLVGRRYGLIVAVYAGLVCWSRLALDRHYLSDIVAASAVGIFGACLLFPRLEPWFGIQRHPPTPNGGASLARSPQS